MQRKLLVILSVSSCFILNAQSPSRRRGNDHDVRDGLMQSSRKDDPDFPTGDGSKLVRFAYVGRVESPQGQLYVVDMRLVLTGMLSPRGNNYVVFFDENHNWLGKERYILTQPLWCRGSKVFLHGVDTDGATQGNAWDLSEGFADRRRVLVSEYGSWTPPEK